MQLRVIPRGVWMGTKGCLPIWSNLGSGTPSQWKYRSTKLLLRWVCAFSVQSTQDAGWPLPLLFLPDGHSLTAYWWHRIWEQEKRGRKRRRGRRGPTSHGPRVVMATLGLSVLNWLSSLHDIYKYVVECTVVSMYLFSTRQDVVCTWFNLFTGVCSSFLCAVETELHRLGLMPKAIVK